jgi:hypothetical protein
MKIVEGLELDAKTLLAGAGALRHMPPMSETKTEVIKVYEIPEDGTAVKVARITNGVSVTLWDTDANMALDTARVWKGPDAENKAIDQAFKQAKKAGYKGRK